VKVIIYVEGGGEKKDAKDLKSKCRKGFQKFFEKAGLAKQMPAIVACGSRDQAYKDFKKALVTPDVMPMLLVDSEAPVTQNSVWRHLWERDQWLHPTSATDEQAHLMVQCMESWFLTDKTCLEAYFGQGFQQRALPQNSKVEEIPKQDLFDGLKNATRRCKTKSSYDKGKHSFEILEKLDPAKVRAAAPYAARLIEILKRETS
jgi:hypothetical protein